jgi:hypothetical protein
MRQSIFTIDDNAIKKDDKQTNFDFLKAQIINAIKMFNSKLETYIKTNISNNDVSDINAMNKKHTINNNAITFINSILPDFFNDIQGLINTFKYKENTDETITIEILQNLRLYFNNMLNCIQTELYKLLKKEGSDASEVSLYSKSQLTNPDDTSEPSILHFLIICDDTSGIASFFNSVSDKMPANYGMEYYISNSINYITNLNFILTIEINTTDVVATKYTLTTTLNTIDQYTENMHYISNNKINKITVDDIMNSSPYDSSVGQIVACVVVGMVGLVFAIYYYIMSESTTNLSVPDNPAKVSNETLSYMNVPNMWSSAKNAFSKLPGISKLPDMSNSPGLKLAGNVTAMMVMMGIILFTFVILFIKFGGRDRLLGSKSDTSSSNTSSSAISSITDTTNNAILNPSVPSVSSITST